MEPLLFYRRNLPHLQPSAGTFFLTYRLYGSIPKSIVKSIQENVEYVKTNNNVLDNGDFVDYEKYLDKSEGDITYLANPLIADLNKEALNFYDKKEYDLLCYCIMPNHVHVVFSLREGSRALFQIMHSVKRHTAREGNKILNS